MSSLIDAVTKAALITYLQARIRDWDVPTWPGQAAPSSVERQLWVTQADLHDDEDRAQMLNDIGAGRELTADEVLAMFDHFQPEGTLVLLGGPGAGKTWQAYRYARRAAQVALDGLTAGRDLDDVRLPLFTTWEQWSNQSPADPARSLVDASFGSALGDDRLDADVIDRVKRVFLHPDRRVLLVLDSLDGAADRQQQTNRLTAVYSLPSWWRLVMTSRPAAWHAACLGGPPRPSAHWVFELQDLDYPDDVDAFIGAWFAGDPRQGETLVRQIRDRDDLRRNAVTPLFLTWYCLLHANEVGSLPGRPRDLRHRLLRHLLAGDRTSGGVSEARIDDCVALLTSWAWDAVRERSSRSGLVDWPDTFTPPTAPPPGQVALVDHVAPRVSDDDGTSARQFVHRSLFEHLVAEHLASLDTKQAADSLLPHLWYDPDWQVVVPAAITSHNQRHPGALLTRLLARIPRVNGALDPARTLAVRELDPLLLAIAAESALYEWPHEQRSVIAHCRERHAADAIAIIRTAHWAYNTNSFQSELLEALPTASPRALTRLVAEQVALDAGDYERAEARSAVLALLPTANPRVVPRLVRALLRLQPTYGDRVRAMGGVIAALPDANAEALIRLAVELSALDPADTERAGIRSDLLATLATTHPHDIAHPVRELVALEPTDAELAEARRTLLSGAATTANPRDVGDYVAALSMLHLTDADRAEARHIIHGRLQAVSDPMSRSRYEDPSQTPWEIADLLRDLATLQPTDTELAEARRYLFGALPTARSYARAYLLSRMPTLGPTDSDLARARQDLMVTLSTDDRGVFVAQVTALAALEPTEVELAEVRRRLLGALAAGDPDVVDVLVAALPALHPTPADLAEARRSLIAVFPTSPPWIPARLLAALPNLNPSDSDLAEIQRGVPAVIAKHNLRDLELFVEILHAVGRISSDPAEAREALLAALRTAHPWSVLNLTAALPALNSTDADRADARTHVRLALLSTRDLASSQSYMVHHFQSSVGHVIAALDGLVSSGADRTEVRLSLLAALEDPAADPCVVADLVAALSSLDPSHDARYEARRRLAEALSTTHPGAIDALTRALRSLTDADDWLTWLNGHAIEDIGHYFSWEETEEVPERTDEETNEIMLRLIRERTESIWETRPADDDLDALADRAYDSFPEPWRSMASRQLVRDHLESLAQDEEGGGED